MSVYPTIEGNFCELLVDLAKLLESDSSLRGQVRPLVDSRREKRENVTFSDSMNKTTRKLGDTWVKTGALPE